MVIKMRIYYVFDMKEEFVSLYKNNARTLYNILRQIYYMHQEDIHYGFNLFNQIVEKIDKGKLDQYLFLKLHLEAVYSKKDNIHIINNLYKDEISKVEVKRTHIKLESNKDASSFFHVLAEYQLNYFVCDFLHQDYFWLNEVKTLV